MSELNDIKDLEDVKLMVNQFYGKIREDELLGPIFDEVIQNRWPEHLEKMYRFWQTVLLDERTYSGRPFIPHMNLPVDTHHFEHWLFLFNETVDELFKGTIATAAKLQGKRMAEMFNMKISYFKQNDSQTPLM